LGVSASSSLLDIKFSKKRKIFLKILNLAKITVHGSKITIIISQHNKLLKDGRAKFIL
jgi:hypothetical protein